MIDLLKEETSLKKKRRALLIVLKSLLPVLTMKKNNFWNMQDTSTQLWKWLVLLGNYCQNSAWIQTLQPRPV